MRMCKYSCCVALSITHMHCPWLLVSMCPTSHHPRFGNCKPFNISEHGTLCKALYTPGVDYVYAKHEETDVKFLNIDIHTNTLRSGITNWCIESVIKIWCQIILPSCGKLSVFELPTSVCMGTCNYVKEKCANMWDLLELYAKNTTDILTPINCSNTGEYLNPFPYCCSDVGVNTRMFSSTG